MDNQSLALLRDAKAPDGWRELIAFREEELEARGWLETSGGWTHPTRPGETFTQQQAEKCEQVADSRKFAESSKET